MDNTIRINKDGRYVDPKTSFVMQMVGETVCGDVEEVVIGKQNKNGQIDPLTGEDIEFCNKYNIDYNLNKMPPAKFDMEKCFHATYEKGKNGKAKGFEIQYEDMLNIFLNSTLEEKEDGSLWVPAMGCAIPANQVSKYSLRGPWDSPDFTEQERWRVWNKECWKQTEKHHKTLEKEVAELKDWVMEASKTMEVLMKEISSLRELVGKISTVSENQQNLLTPLQLQQKS